MKNPHATAEQRKRLRRKLFIETAVSLFSSRGYHETTVPMIVAESRTSTGSFYQYFRSKEDVLHEALLDYGQRIAQSTKELDASMDNPRLHLRNAIEKLFLQLTQDPHRARLLLIETSGLSIRIQQARNEILQAQTRNVQAYLARNGYNLPELELWVISHCIVGSIHQVYCAWCDSSLNNSVSASTVAHRISDFLLDAVP